MNIDGVEYMDVQEAAEFLGVTTGRVRHLIYSDTLENIKIGNVNLVTVESVTMHKRNRRVGRPPRRED